MHFFFEHNVTRAKLYEIIMTKFTKTPRPFPFSENNVSGSDCLLSKILPCPQDKGGPCHSAWIGGGWSQSVSRSEGTRKALYGSV